MMFKFKKRYIFLLTLPALFAMFQNFDVNSDQYALEEMSYDDIKDPNYVLIGDMYVHKSAVNKEDLELFFNEVQDLKHSTKTFGAYEDYIELWPDGVLPIQFENFSVSSQEVFMNYCGYISAVANVHCVMKTTEKDYIKVRSTSNNSICGSSYYGKIGGEQTLTINIDNGCLNERVVLHEIMHALGIAHEQNRSDRDDFVNINWDNINELYRHNFARVLPSALKTSEYDFDSIMHYSSLSFSLDSSVFAMERKEEVFVSGNRCNNSSAPYYSKLSCDEEGWTFEIPYNRTWSNHDKEILVMGYGAATGEHIIYFKEFSKLLNLDEVIEKLKFDEISPGSKKISVKVEGQSGRLFSILINNGSANSHAQRIKEQAESIVTTATLNFLAF